MPQVASETNAHAVSYAGANAARPNTGTEQKPTSPFESLLNEAQPAGDPSNAAKNQAGNDSSASQAGNQSKANTQGKDVKVGKTISSSNEITVGKIAKAGNEVKAANSIEAEVAATISTGQGDTTNKNSVEIKAAATLQAATQAPAQVPAQVPAKNAAQDTGQPLTLAGELGSATKNSKSGKAGKTAKSDKTDKIDKADKKDKGSQPATITVATSTGGSPVSNVAAPVSIAAIAPTQADTANTDAASATGAASASPIQQTVAAHATVILAAASAPASNKTITAKATKTAAAPADRGKAADPALPANDNAKADDPQPTNLVGNDASQPTTAGSAKGDHQSAAVGHDSVSSTHRTEILTISATAHGDSAAAGKPTANVPQPFNLPLPAHQQAAASATSSAPPAPQVLPQAAAVPLAGVAIEIAGQVLADKNQFEIRLDPPELGRIEVRLDVDKDGRITAHLMADRADTLSLLQHDASGLQRALQNTGLKTADNGLQFSLRDQSMSQQQQQQQQPTNSGNRVELAINDPTLPASAPAPRGYSRIAVRAGGVDIWV